MTCTCSTGAKEAIRMSHFLNEQVIGTMALEDMPVPQRAVVEMFRKTLRTLIDNRNLSLCSECNNKWRIY